MLRFANLRVEVSTTKKIAVALATLGLVIAGAGFVAYKSYANSRDVSAHAAADRQVALVAERTISAFWQERESIGEHLFGSSRATGLEAVGRRRAFEALAATGRAGSHHHDAGVNNGAYFARAVSANAALFSTYEHDRGSTDPFVIRNTLAALHAAEVSVLNPLRTVSRLNKTHAESEAATARRAERDALYIELASALVVLAGIAWFAFFAAGLVRRVDRQKASLAEADQHKDEFIATISHELRTPITSIRGYVELLLDEETEDADPLSGEQRTFLQTIGRNCARLLRLVNDLLLVAQEQAGRLEMDKAPCDLVEVAREAVEAGQAAAAKQNVSLSFDSSLDHAPATADAARIGQAIDNLVSNAIKFTPPGGCVTVEISRLMNRSVITVADTGMGMQPAEVDQLFEQFFRTQSARVAQVQGTGLGLAITKMIVEAHDGTITLASEPYVGTTVTISLPPLSRGSATAADKTSEVDISNQPSGAASNTSR